MDPELHTDRFDAILRSVNESLAGTSLTPPATLQPGQVWRARWDDVLALVFIDAIHDGVRNLVRVAPVRIGTDEADDSAIILPETTNTFSEALSIWPELVTEIAEVVLERWVAHIDTFDSLAAMEAAAEAGILRRGLPILNETSPRYRDLTTLKLAMKLLSLAAALPSGSGKLGVLLGGIVVSTIAGIIEVEPKVALGILRGEIAIDRQQAEHLATAFDHDPEELLAANPAMPDELQTTLTALGRSDQVRRLAKHHQMSESEAFTNAAWCSYALAARNEGAMRDWAGRVDRYFETALTA